MKPKLAVSSYSFHRFGWGPEGDNKPSLEQMIDKCSELGLDGIELLGVHFEKSEPAYLHTLKQYAFMRGVDIVAISAHHNFVHPDYSIRVEELNKLVRWIDVAYELGVPTVRAFGGRWNTIKSFEDFMAASGDEPPLDGYTDDDAFDWSIECFKIASYYAGKKGVTVALENHWGLTGKAEGVLRIINSVKSPWLKVVLDTGNFNFCPDQYEEMRTLLPYVVMLHAKTYFGGGIFYDAGLDYQKIGQMLREANFSGYVSIEFEGKDHPDKGIPSSIELLRSSL